MFGVPEESILKIFCFIYIVILKYWSQKPLSDDIDLLQAIYKLPSQNQWAVIMLGGGHFAAAIFKGAITICC